MPPSCCPPADPDARLVFVHVPKTGGTSLHAALARHFAPEAIVHAVAPADWRDALVPSSPVRFVSGHMRFSTAALMPGPRRIVTVLRDPVERLVSLYTFWKRHQNPGQPDLREAMEKDLLGFLRSSEPQVRAAVDNAVARQLFGAALVAPHGSWFTPAGGGGSMPLSAEEVLAGALENLDACDVVGVMDDLAGFYRRICNALGMTPGSEPGRLNTREDPPPGLAEAPPPEPLTAEILAELDRLTRLDRAVYDAARARAAGLRPAGPAKASGAGHRPAWSLDPIGFVEAVFQGLLGRRPKPAGLTVHAVALAEGALMPADMIRQFADTEEFRARQAARR